MITLGSGLVAYWGTEALATAADDIEVPLLNQAGVRFSAEVLKRREICALLRRAYAIAIGVLERHALNRVQDKHGEGSAQSEAVLSAFGRLREHGAALFDAQAGKKVDPTAPPQQTAITIRSLLRASKPIPAPAATLVEKHLRQALAYGLHEVTTRADDTMWARIHHLLLTSLRGVTEISEQRRRTLSERLNQLDNLLARDEEFRAFKREFEDDLEAVVPRAETQIRTFADLEAARIRRQPLTDDRSDAPDRALEVTPAGRGRHQEPVRAIAVVIDEKGKRIAAHPLLDGVVTVGRTEDNALRLPHPTVSGRHAMIRIATDEAAEVKLVVRDLGSTNGTYRLTAEGQVQIRESAIALGDKITVGGVLSLQILSAQEFEAAAGELSAVDSQMPGVLKRLLKR